MTVARPLLAYYALRASHCLDPPPVTCPTTRECKEADVGRDVGPQWGGFASISRVTCRYPASKQAKRTKVTALDQTLRGLELVAHVAQVAGTHLRSRGGTRRVVRARNWHHSGRGERFLRAVERMALKRRLLNVDLGSTTGREVQLLQLYYKEHSNIEPTNLRIISQPNIQRRLSYASRQLT